MRKRSDIRKNLHVGIDAGSVSLNCMIIDSGRSIVNEFPYTRHLGRVQECVLGLISDIYEKYGMENIASISFTGGHGQIFSKRLGVLFEHETITQILGSLAVQPDARTIIGMGGQNTAIFQIVHHNGTWELEYFNSNGPCASGTGSFIDQQAQRIATSLYTEEVDISQKHIDSILSDFIRLGLESKNPANVACRCTVFTKTDMIHLQNRGERLDDIIYGLHVGNARNYMGTIVSSRTLYDPVIFIGGLSKNEIQMKALKKYLPTLTVPEHSTTLGALGVALQALETGEGRKAGLDELKSLGADRKLSFPVAPRLALNRTLFSDENDLPIRKSSRRIRVYLGVDIGSTTTKYVLLDEDRAIVHKHYVLTQGRPINVTQDMLGLIRRELGDKIEIAGTATTGSGRYVVGDFLNADLIIDEITAHAGGALESDSTVDTIFEIGGQDSKYISISSSSPLDFDMNKVCAAGTGSFLHELANKYGINIVGEFQDIALSSKSPVQLADRCTVFMESDLQAYHQKGAARKDLVAGLCYAIVYNYLNRVVGKRRIGKRIMFLGGTSLNKGVVAAFENVLGRALIVPQHREVFGAYGAAISVQEKMRSKRRSTSAFRGLESAINDRMEHTERTCRANPQCHNQCKLKIYSFGGRKTVWGGECGRYEVAREGEQVKKNYFSLRQEIWNEYIDGVHTVYTGKPLMEVDGRPTIGIQRTLYGLHSGVLWAHFYDRLGYRLVFSPPTDIHISTKGVERVECETCYPVKVSHGHIHELAGKTRYLFLPSIINLHTPEPKEAGCYCPMVQSNAYMVRAALEIDPSSVLSPVIHLKHDLNALSIEIAKQIGSKLGVTRSSIKKALDYASNVNNDFIRELYRKGDRILSLHDPDEPVVIVTGRPYNLYDERLNLRLGHHLSKIGITALPMDFVDADAVNITDFPKIYWGIGVRILKTAGYIKYHANCFGLHLTNFSCGVDSFLEHFYKHKMGSKPYLVLELDEHTAEAGVMTRLEAFKNVIVNAMRRNELLPACRAKAEKDGIGETDPLSVVE